MYLGVDDTDSVTGMCTTYLATELVKEFSELDLIGNPRLVRLNPNVPWKTRGNGAVAMRFGKGRGKPKVIGDIDGISLVCHQTGHPINTGKALFERACAVVERMAVFDDDNTNPGIVMAGDKPPPSLYWKAVRGVVDLEAHLERAKVDFARGYKNKRGLIGAISALAWHPHDRTYELIAYRHQSCWGKPRDVDEASVQKMDRAVTTTFNNYDYEEGHTTITPHSPCPVLFGIRGDVEADLHKAAGMVKSEGRARWMVYLTNQGTDDHLRRAAISALRPYTSVKVKGWVANRPKKIPGGHLIFGLASGGHEVDCTIYEPAKGFRDIGAGLIPGDRLTVYGGVREEPFTINVEKLRVEALAEERIKVANPLCSKCGKRMKSAGKDQGFRCTACGTKAKESEAEFGKFKRNIKLGWYEPPVGSRRHLSMPLKRF